MWPPFGRGTTRHRCHSRKPTSARLPKVRRLDADRDERLVVGHEDRRKVDGRRRRVGARPAVPGRQRVCDGAYRTQPRIHVWQRTDARHQPLRRFCRRDVHEKHLGLLPSSRREHSRELVGGKVAPRQVTCRGPARLEVKVHREECAQYRLLAEVQHRSRLQRVVFVDPAPPLVRHRRVPLSQRLGHPRRVLLKHPVPLAAPHHRVSRVEAAGRVELFCRPPPTARARGRAPQ